MKVNDFVQIIEKFAPKELAEEWDNVGLLVGDANAQVSGVVVCVDLTDDCIDFAIKNKSNLIVTHHPAIFNSIKSVTADDYIQNLLLKCIKCDINVYSAHTNMDNAIGGINDATAAALGIKSERFLPDGLGVCGKFTGRFDDLVEEIIQLTGDMQPKTYKCNDDLQKIAFIGGSGGGIDEIVDVAIEKGLNCIVSSEFKHHIILKLLANNINILQIGHYESEVIFVDIVCDLLKNVDCNIEKYYCKLI